MKTSNKILIALLVVFITTCIIVDFSLKTVYLKIDKTSAYRNYEPVSIRPFKFLKLIGGNGYAIAVKQASYTDMKVMSSRKSFLTTSYDHDTLLVHFTVTSIAKDKIDNNLNKGLIITCPGLKEIHADGTALFLQNWNATDLRLNLEGNAYAMSREVKLSRLSVLGTQNSFLNFESANQINQLDLTLKNNASAYFKDISYIDCNPNLTGDAIIILNGLSAGKLKKH